MAVFYTQKKGRVFILFLLFMLACTYGKAQVDTVQHLKEIEVKSTPLPQTLQHTTPLQVFNSHSLSQIQAIGLSDVVKRFSGITVRDYGGIGGLKTVAVRGLGANHTAISYDGITLTDSQTGQIDLGRFSVSNLKEVSLSIGIPDELLSTARAFASGSLLSLQTKAPRFAESKKIGAEATVKYGSFGLWMPTLVMQNRLSKNVSSSFLAEWQHAHGHYPYTLDYGGNTSDEQRHNTDVNSLRLEENLFANLPKGAMLTSKIYYYGSERGLPGATIYYNPHSSQRLWDKNFFVQSGYEKALSYKLQTAFHLKYTRSYLRYLDPDYLGTVGKIENDFSQQEAYLSGAAKYTLSDAINLALSTDGFFNTMNANLYSFPYPSRYSWLTAINGKYHNTYLDVQLGALSTLVEERVKEGTPAASQQKITPSFSAGFRPLGNENWLLRFFYKDIFRLPTFNDLYYTGVGNNRLLPEQAKQLNLGMAYTKSWQKNDAYLSASMDVYHNQVKDKIVAIPTKNLFIWSMMNVGAVHINGADVTLKSGYTLRPSLSLGLEASYSYQQAEDRTNPESKTYGHQIAYTPLHSGSAIFAMHSRLADFSYNLLFAGERYTLNQNTHTNRLKGYTEHGVMVRKKLVLGQLQTTFSLEVLNAFNTQYEVIRNFPMPGRAYRLTVQLTI